MNLTRHGLLVAAIVGMGLPALIGYAMKQQPHRLPDVHGSSALAFAPRTRVLRHTEGSRSMLWQTVRPDLFSGEASPPPPPPAALPAVPPPPVLPVLAPTPDPLADYTYAGTVTVDGEMSALIEHRKSREGWYVREGDAWQNYRILAVNDREVTVEVNGESHILTKSDAVNVIPLTANADQGSSSVESTAGINLVDGLIAALGNSLITVDSSNGMIPMVLSGVEATPGQEGAISGRIASEKAAVDLNQSNVKNTAVFRLESAAISLTNQGGMVLIR